MRHNGKRKVMEIGTKIIGNFGAMIPLSFGEIVKVDKKTKLMGFWQNPKNKTFGIFHILTFWGFQIL